jgi:hypothetical protein
VALELRVLDDSKVEGDWTLKGGPCKGTYPLAGMRRADQLVLDFKAEGDCPPVKRIRFEITPGALIWRPQGDEVRLTR